MTEPGRTNSWFSPRVRLLLSRVIVAVGIIVALVAIVTGRHGFLFVAVIVIGLGAAMGPGRRKG
jgi:hypothetical protein